MIQNTVKIAGGSSLPLGMVSVIYKSRLRVKRCCDNLNSSENNSISQALLYHYRVHNIQFILDVYAHIYTCTYTNVHTYVHTQTHTHTVLPTFIMEGNARFDFQVSENKDVTFFLTDSQSPWGSLNFQLRIAPKPFLQTCSQEEV